MDSGPLADKRPMGGEGWQQLYLGKAHSTRFSDPAGPALTSSDPSSTQPCVLGARVVLEEGTEREPRGAGQRCWPHL